MRYLLKIQPYEKPIAAGSFRYEQDGAPNGIVEHWQLSHALDGFKFFRVDVDARNHQANGYSTLYNVVLGSDGQPENVKFRHFTTTPPTAENGLKLKGQIDFDEGTTFISREWNDQRIEDEFDGLHNLVLPTAAQPIRKQLSGKMLTLDQKDYFQPMATVTQPKILETAESRYPTKVKFSDSSIAVSTRLMIYR